MKRGAVQLQILFATILSSSTLLFLVEPILAKALLPRFGGAAGVWNTCLLFFQTVLLIGYTYAWLLLRVPKKTWQIAIHSICLALGLILIPIVQLPLQGMMDQPHPITVILKWLIIVIGLPFMMLSSTGPLLQSWYLEGQHRGPSFRVFAFSNVASIVSLLAYPLILEPLTSRGLQWRLWSISYCCFTALYAFVVIRSLTQAERTNDRVGRIEKLGMKTYAECVMLAACASILWMSVANYLSQQIAPIPLLWVLPLSVYLATFVLCFEMGAVYKRPVFRWLVPLSILSVLLMHFASYAGLISGLIIQASVLLIVLAICCIFCHGEIAALAPQDASDVTAYYLAVAGGGVLGTSFVALCAPQLFSTYLEFPLGLVGCLILARVFLFGYTSLGQIAMFGAIAIGGVLYAEQMSGQQSIIRLRNFYGAVDVKDRQVAGHAVRFLYNSSTLHGSEILEPGYQEEPTTYYGYNSGIGRLMACDDTTNKVIGVVGLGVGTIATYGRVGDRLEFFEINPQVIDVAKKYFMFLARARAAINIQIDDGRLGLARNPDHTFDMIVLDAFSGDVIPVHLLTREAFDQYFRLLRPGGVLAIHISNSYVTFGPVIRQLAAVSGKHVTEIISSADATMTTRPADWILVSGDIAKLSCAGRIEDPRGMRTSRRVWTDDFSNLLEIIKK